MIKFDDWCIKNNHKEYIDAWDEIANGNIHNYNSTDRSRCVFKFDNNAIYLSVAAITQDGISPVDKYHRSFGYYLLSEFGDDAIKKYWSDENTFSPFELYSKSRKSIYINCIKTDYHGSYKTTPDRFVGQKQRCPYCAHMQIHPNDSFANYHIKNTDSDFLSKYWMSDNDVDPYTIAPRDNNTKIHIQCQKMEYHSYMTTPDIFTDGHRCPFCSSGLKDVVHRLDSFGAKNPEKIQFWSNKNKKSPYEVRVGSNESVWFMCENGIHDDYQRTPHLLLHSYFGCPLCHEAPLVSSYEKSVLDFLCQYDYSILTERNCTIIPINPFTNYQMPFDNEIMELKLIIEVHGIQHYELNGWHKAQSTNSGKTPEEEFEYQKWKDNYKKNYAIECGYNYLEVPYWTIETGEYKDLIDGMIRKLSHNIKTLETAG